MPKIFAHIAFLPARRCVLCLLSDYCVFDFSVYYMCIQYFDTVVRVFLTCKNRLPYNLYCVGGDVNHSSIQPARRYASAGLCDSNVSVRHEPVLCQNEES